jgi:4-carboxymuconolactone decarboxylase
VRNFVTFEKVILATCASLALVNIAAAQERLAPIPPDKQTDEQKKAVAQMVGPFPVGGPFAAFLRDPGMDVHAYALATHYRNSPVLGVKLTEFAIMMVARDWSQAFEWEAHYKRALDAGVKAETLAAIGERRRPAAMPEDEEIVYDFCTELSRNKGVSDATYARAIKKFGEQGVVMLTGLHGYYVMLATLLNVARTPVPNPQNPTMPALPQ